MPFFRPASRALSHLLRHDPTCHLSSAASLFSRHSPLAPFSRTFDHPFFSSPLYTIYEVRDGDKDSSHTKAEQHKPEEAKAAEPQQPQQQQSNDSRLASRHKDSHRQRWLNHRSDRRHRHRHHSHNHHHHPLSLFSPFDSLLASSPFFQQAAALHPLEIKVDLYSTPTAYQVNAAIPGVRKEDIKLTVEDGVLTIEAERREERVRSSKPTATASTASTPITTSSSTSQSSAAAEASQAEQKSVEVEAKAGGVDTKPVAETKAQEPQQQQQQEMDEDEDEEVAVHHVESHYGRVQRSLALPEDVNVDGLTARYEDGVLRIELPRVEEKKQQVKQINIQ